MRRAFLTLVPLLLVACSVELPDPDDPGARVYRNRCGGCHRLYAPQSMTFGMWQVQLERMERLYAERGIRWLSPAEQHALLRYLETHAGSE